MLKPLSLSLVCVCVCLFLKKRVGNCPTLFERVYCMQYNLPHPPLKVTMAFKWSCGVLLCQNLFSSPLCVCVFASQGKKKKMHITFLPLHYIIKFTTTSSPTTTTTTKGLQLVYHVFSLWRLFFLASYILQFVFSFSLFGKRCSLYFFILEITRKIY